MALAIAGVEVAVFLRELPEGNFRLSLRSKGKIDVAAIAERVGGGGHVTASGCTLDGPLDAALEKILAEVRPAMAC
jgi:phosphoesterase RecJ-like protein